jgi:hypothetical protein
MPAELLVERRGDGLLFATFVEHGNPVARTIWAGVEAVHVPIVRRLLERVARCRELTGPGTAPSP